MSQYSYTCEQCGETTEITAGMKEEHPDSVTCPKCQGKALRDIGRDLMSRKQRRANTWPLASDAMGVHPDQIEEFTKDARERGVPIEFDRLARPIFTGPRHRRDYCRAYGVHDLNGGYSDP